MSDMNVNSATPNYYKQSVPRSAVETGIIGAGIGAVSSTVRNKKALKEFVTSQVKSDEFKSLALNEKQEIIKGMKAIRNNFKKIVLKDAGTTALWGIAIGAIGTIISNAISKSTAKKQAAKVQ